MFGNLSSMMGKLKEAQKNIEETKIRLNTILTDGEAINGQVKVTVNANSTIKNITISKELTDNQEIEGYLLITLNKALQKAKSINEAELAAAAKDGMPNIPVMDLFK